LTHRRALARDKSKERPMARSNNNLSGMTFNEIQAELRRRQRQVNGLQRRRETLMKKLDALNKQIHELGGGLSLRGRNGARIRPKNSMNLVEALGKTLKGKTYNVTSLAEQVQKEGYQTTSPNFRTIVNQTLIKYPKLFKRVGRGQYTAI
jgi:hypothetical protein